MASVDPSDPRVVHFTSYTGRPMQERRPFPVTTPFPTFTEAVRNFNSMEYARIFTYGGVAFPMGYYLGGKSNRYITALTAAYIGVSGGICHAWFSSSARLSGFKE